MGNFNENSGFITVYRSILNHWIYQNDKYFKWWITMLLEVNFKDKNFVRNYEVHTITRGQSCNSLRRWAMLFDTTPKTVQRFFNMLEKNDMISMQKIGKGKQALTLININKFNDYQLLGKQDLPQEVNKKYTKSKQALPTNNNVNKVNNDNNVNNILDRKINFAQSIKDIFNSDFKDVDLNTVKEFIDYWTEHGEKDKKMRFEKQKSFNKKLRIGRWLKNQKEWKNKTANEKPKTLAQKMRQDYGIN